MIFSINKKIVLGSSFLVLLLCVDFVHAFRVGENNVGKELCNYFIATSLNSFKNFFSKALTKAPTVVTGEDIFKEQVNDLIDGFCQRTSAPYVIIEGLRQAGTSAISKESIDNVLNEHFKKVPHYIDKIKNQFKSCNGIEQLVSTLTFYFKKEQKICNQAIQDLYDKKPIPTVGIDGEMLQALKTNVSMMLQNKKDYQDCLSCFEQFDPSLPVLNHLHKIPPPAEPGLEKAPPMAFVTKAPIASEYSPVEPEVKQEQPIVVDTKKVIATQSEPEKIVSQASQIVNKGLWERCKTFCVQHKTALIGVSGAAALCGVGYLIYKTIISSKKNDFKKQLHIRKRNIEMLRGTMKNYKKNQRRISR
ncbi:MAG: hypothetical protein US69_C0002G0008 [candidate division TM6 bacterium GW2011_GWF2_38_10]|nr:MAG: hypothetical protein US69_C0002G0008 [candidate division TM6 bacterium GW2011_GWF2_38_10]